MRKVNIGGVPEHFNLSWYLTLKNKEYIKEGINLRWKDYFGGTGQMCKALRDNEIDLAVILTLKILIKRRCVYAQNMQAHSKPYQMSVSRMSY